MVHPMITFHPSFAETGFRLKVVVEAVAEHNGRFFVGESMQNRKEMRTGLEALNTFISQAQAGGNGKLYLTPKAVHSRKTRQDKWNEACNQAREGLVKVRSLQTDAEMWIAKLTRKGNAATEQILTEIANLDVEQAQLTIDTASTITFPKGFGRD